ncbi:hypothetical protein HOY82DRAFT_580484 [Tuber indicum]|nr:hypothetical protein HOY82DRAFT_580484 [Tuber indicum]
MAWFCSFCGFGPHNPELHLACIECGRRANGEACDEQRPGSRSYPNSQNADSANAFLVPDTIMRNHST